MAASASVRSPYIALKVIAAPTPWTAVLLPVSAFPTPAPELSSVRALLQRLTGQVAASRKLATEVFLQFNQLHLADGSDRLSSHARDWTPELGLGVWPDREPPALWTAADFENLQPGGKPRALTYKLFRIAPAPARLAAWEVMLGLGCVVEILTADTSDAFLKKNKTLLLPRIKEKSFRSFRFYLPLVERKTVEGAKAEDLDTWFCGATLYLRESAEDSGVLIVSKEPLQPAVEKLGGRLEPSAEPEWRIPA